MNTEIKFEIKFRAKKKNSVYIYIHNPLDQIFYDIFSNSLYYKSIIKVGNIITVFNSA